VIFWIPGSWRGRLGIALRPRGGDWLDDDVAAWRRMGVDVVVSCLEPHEEVDLALENESAAATGAGLGYKRFRIPDRGVPHSPDDLGVVAAGLADAIATGSSVVIHCRQSVGRSSIVAAAVLIAMGHDANAAFALVRGARGVAVPETDDQRRWVLDFARAQHRC